MKEFKPIERQLKRIEMLLTLIEEKKSLWIEEETDPKEIQKIHLQLVDIKKKMNTLTNFQQEQLGPLTERFKSVDYDQYPIFGKIAALKRRIEDHQKRLLKKIGPPEKKKDKKLQELSEFEEDQQKKLHDRRFKRMKKQDKWKKL